MKHNAYLLLGSNSGDMTTILSQARLMIEREVGDIDDQSSFYKTEPWGMASESWFINQVIRINTKLSPVELLNALLSIEMKLGRVRNANFALIDRTLDIDILYYDAIIYEDSNLTVPHPRLHLRQFTLLPLCEIAPEYINPKLTLTNQELLAQSEDNSKVIRIQ